MSEHTGRPRTAAGAAVSAALAAGRVELQSCAACGTVHYPPAEICRRCLHGRLELTPCDRGATVIASTAVHRSYAVDFADGGPWFVASVKMKAGPVAFVHVPDLLGGGTAVELVPLIDRLGDGVLGAVADPGERDLLQARVGKPS